MEPILEFLRNTDITANALEVVASIAAALWAAYTGSRWHAKAKESRFSAMYDAIVVGARVTYTNVYKRLKDQLAKSGGVLSKDDVARLSEYAYSEAVRAARDESIKQALVGLTEEEWDRLLSKAVGQLKQEGGKAPAAA